VKFGVNKLETFLYRTVWSVFRYLEPFRRRSRVWQTDRQTNRHCNSTGRDSLLCAANKTRKHSENLETQKALSAPLSPLPRNFLRFYW